MIASIEASVEASMEASVPAPMAVLVAVLVEVSVDGTAWRGGDGMDLILSIRSTTSVMRPGYS